MTDSVRSTFTTILRRVSDGDSNASRDLFAVVYEELRAMARARMIGIPNRATLQPTALVHEVYVRLLGDEVENWEDRRQFFFAAGRAMRDILVEQARRRASLRRGGDHRRIDVGPDEIEIQEPEVDVLALHEAIVELEAQNPDYARLVMLRYFVGLPIQDAADLLGISRATANRQWRFVRVWLLKRLDDSGEPDG